MSKIKNILTTSGAATIFVILILLCGYGASWAITCGIIKLITLCFGWTFKWKIATGIWLIICLLQLIFKSSDK
jgi:hypothetical protein